MKYTVEQKRQYFKNLRLQWRASKELAEKDEKSKAIFLEVQRTTDSKQMSYISFYFTMQDMIREGFEGLPYIDCKTFEGWKLSGFKIKKGEKSKIRGIVWLEHEEENEGDTFVYPKVYSLFHRSQVEAMGELN